MEFKFRVKGKFNKPVDQVFDAVKDPEKLAQYFAEEGASAPLEANNTVVWKFDGGYEIPVTVVESVTNERIVFEWDSGDKIPTREQLEKIHHRSHRMCFIANSVKTEIVTEIVA